MQSANLSAAEADEIVDVVAVASVVAADDEDSEQCDAAIQAELARVSSL